MLFKNSNSKQIDSAYKDTNLSFSGCDMIATANISLGLSGRSYFVTLGSIQTISYSIHMEKSPVRSLGNVNAKDYVYGQRTIAGSLIFAVFNRHVLYELFEKIRGEYPELLNNKNIIMDEIPPFDIAISYANEYGIRASMALYGVRIINEGQTMSINDIYTENTYQFVATDIEYLSSDEARGGLNKGKTSPVVLPETVTPANVGEAIVLKKEYNLEIIRDYDLNKNEVVHKVIVSIKNIDIQKENLLRFRLDGELDKRRNIREEKDNIFIIPKNHNMSSNSRSEVVIAEGEDIVYSNYIGAIKARDSDNYTKERLHRESYSDIVIMSKSKDKLIVNINKYNKKNKIGYLNNIDNLLKEKNSNKIIVAEMLNLEGLSNIGRKYIKFFIDEIESETIYVNDIIDFNRIIDMIEKNIKEKNSVHKEWLLALKNNITTVDNAFEESANLYKEYFYKEYAPELFHIAQSAQKELNNSLIINNKNYIEELDQKKIKVKNHVGKIIVKSLEKNSKDIYPIENRDLTLKTFESKLNLKSNSKYIIELRDHLGYTIQFAYLLVPSNKLMRDMRIIKYELKDRVKIAYSRTIEHEGNMYRDLILEFEEDIGEIEYLYIKHDGHLKVIEQEQIEIEDLTNNIIKVKRIERNYDMLRTNDEEEIEIYLSIEEGE